MAVKFYMDVHVPQAITDQLRRRRVEVVTAIEDGRDRAEDHELLQRADELGCVVFTQDIRFLSLAERYQAESRPFAGLIFAHPLSATIGQLVRDLELIASASTTDEWRNQTERLPFR